MRSSETSSIAMTITWRFFVILQNFKTVNTFQRLHHSLWRNCSADKRLSPFRDIMCKTEYFWICIIYSYMYVWTHRGQSPLLLTWINLNPSLDNISNHLPGKVWGEITYLFLNFSGCTVEVYEWITNFIHIFNGCNYLSMLEVKPAQWVLFKVVFRD